MYENFFNITAIKMKALIIFKGYFIVIAMNFFILFGVKIQGKAKKATKPRK